jgi:hypothetical protein
MEGRTIARRGRGGSKLVSVGTLHGAMARGWPVGGSSGWSGGVRGEQLDRLGQLGFDCRVQRNAGLKMKKSN